MKKKAPRRTDDTGVLRQYFPPAPNPMFSPLQHLMTRFVRYQESVPCACCGRMSKHHWTSLVRFKAIRLDSFWVEKRAPWIPAGKPVCRAHPMQMDWRAAERWGKREVARIKARTREDPPT